MVSLQMMNRAIKNEALNVNNARHKRKSLSFIVRDFLRNQTVFYIINTSLSLRRGGNRIFARISINLHYGAVNVESGKFQFWCTKIRVKFIRVVWAAALRLMKWEPSIKTMRLMHLVQQYKLNVHHRGVGLKQVRTTNTATRYALTFVHVHAEGKIKCSKFSIICKCAAEII